MTLDRIVVGIDFSPPSFEAARWVARHFAPEAELVLAHVIAIPEAPPVVRSRYPRRELLVETLREGADARLRELARSLGTDRVRVDIREGHAATDLVDIAREHAADLLVVGAHGERAGVLEGLGSTAEQLVRVATTPVLLAVAPRDRSPARILVPVDESDITVRVLRAARSLGEQFGGEVKGLHVVRSGVMSHLLAAATTLSGTPPIPRETLQPDAHARAGGWLDRFVEASADAGGDLSTDVVFGDPAREIVALAERWETDLIVIGRRGSSGFRRAVLGSVVGAVLRHAPCPALVVPEDEAT